jgi:hypothetical protein
MPANHSLVSVLMSAVTAGLCASHGGGILDLADSPDLRIEVPAGWNVTEKPVDPRGVHTYEFRPVDGKNEVVLVSAFSAHNQRAHDWVEHGSRSAAAQSVEGKLAVESMCPGKDGGYYFSATDRAPEPDGYRYMTQGALVHQNHAVTFTAFTNGDRDAQKAKLLDMLRGLACNGAPPETLAPAQRASAAAPARPGTAPAGGPGLDLELRPAVDASWAAHVSLPGFALDFQHPLKTGGEMFQAHNDATGLVVSAFAMPQDDSPTSEECRRRIWSGHDTTRAKTPGGVVLDTSTHGDWAIGEMTISVGDMHDRNWNAFQGLESGCFEVHISSITAPDESGFADVLDRVTIR